MKYWLPEQEAVSCFVVLTESQMAGATLLKTSEFGEAIVSNL